MHIVIARKPDERPTATVVTGHPDLDQLQGYVGGYIDAVTCWGRIGERRVTLWVHDEGLLLGLPPTVAVNHGNGEQSLLVGNIVVTTDDAEGETVDMTEAEVERFLGAWTSGLCADVEVSSQWNSEYDDCVYEAVPVLQFLRFIGNYKVNGVAVVNISDYYETSGQHGEMSTASWEHSEVIETEGERRLVPVPPTVAELLGTEEVQA